MRTRFHLAVALVTALLYATARAQPIPPSLPDIDRLAAEPDAEVTRRADGAVEAVTLRRNGVVISSTRQGDRVQTIGQDETGHGAVLCAWSIYVELRIGLDVCSPGSHPELHRELDSAISAINDFIVANSLVPTSTQALTSVIAARETAVRAQVVAPGSDQLSSKCALPAVNQMITRLSQIPRADWQTSIGNLLSVPRPPVMNPCL